jgi:DNA-binding FadR family transcriptional regulator
MMSISETIIQRSGLADTVAGKIKELIKSGKYNTGDRLASEPELMQQFGVGRSSIREAIRILSNCGLVRVQQGIGTFVELREGIAEPLHLRLNRANGDDLNEVRQLLELKIAEKAAGNRTEEDIRIMTGFLQQRNDAANSNLIEECLNADINFHISIALAAKNDILADLYKTVAAQMKKSFMQVMVDTEIFKQKKDMHAALLQSVIDQDSKKAWYWAAKITGQIC